MMLGLMDLLYLLLILPLPIISFLSHDYIPQSVNFEYKRISNRLCLNRHQEDPISKKSVEKYITLPRLYVGSLPIGETSESSVILTKGFNFELNPDQVHYVTKVMRIDGKRKSQLRLFNGISGEWLGKVQSLGRNRRRNEVYVQCQQNIRSQPNEIEEENLPWVIFAPLKKARTKLLLEKCTELGSGRFIWINTDRTDASSLIACQDGAKKLSLQIIEASEQSERLTLPSLSRYITEKPGSKGGPLSVNELLNFWQYENLKGRTLLICRERSTEVTSLLATLGDDISKVAFLIGPEGGWSAEEEASFEAAEATCNGKIQSVSIGSLVLRAETAAMASLAAYSVHIDYLKSREK